MLGTLATPFANIFIDPSDQTARHGEGLFPRSFMIVLLTPSNYVGPEQFGLDRDTEAGILVPQDALPVIKTLEDSEQWLPSGHRNGHPTEGIPDSIKQPMRSNILTCAALRARGQTTEHNSMLIHVTRFTSVQHLVAEAVGNELHSLVNSLRYGDGAYSPSLLDRLRQQWKDDFEPTTQAIIDRGFDDPEITRLAWDEVEPHLVDAASAITLKVINGTVADILEYRNNPHGTSLIAIGGDKLSRGLTLEGLRSATSSGSSRMYDTLMQMGRWFGYRPGYLDLCRLYTTGDLIGWYRHIALASVELKREFEHMAAIGGTPQDYGLRVRTHPNGLQITGASKLRTGTVMRVSFSGTIAETIVLFAEPSILRENAYAVERFLARIDHLVSRRTRGERSIWPAVPADEVIRFLREYRTHPQALKVNSDIIAEFIGKKLADGGLQDWEVVLVQGGEAQMRCRDTPRRRRHDDATRERVMAGCLRNSAFGDSSIQPTSSLTSQMTRRREA